VTRLLLSGVPLSFFGFGPGLIASIVFIGIEFKMFLKLDFVLIRKVSNNSLIIPNSILEHPYSVYQNKYSLNEMNYPTLKISSHWVVKLGLTFSLSSSIVLKSLGGHSNRSAAVVLIESFIRSLN